MGWRGGLGQNYSNCLDSHDILYLKTQSRHRYLLIQTAHHPVPPRQSYNRLPRIYITSRHPPLDFLIPTSTSSPAFCTSRSTERTSNNTQFLIHTTFIFVTSLSYSHVLSVYFIFLQELQNHNEPLVLRMFLYLSLSPNLNIH